MQQTQALLLSKVVTVGSHFVLPVQQDRGQGVQKVLSFRLLV